LLDVLDAIPAAPELVQATTMCQCGINGRASRRHPWQRVAQDAIEARAHGAFAPCHRPDHVEQRILLLRGERVMLDADLAALYGVETRALARAVKRNRVRFPRDFIFQLTAEEASRGGRRYAP
jgi:hypothetical protein